jgi:FkbH-like protein
MAKSYSPEIEILIDAVLSQASACLQNRIFLQNIDWSKIGHKKIETMLENFDNAGKKATPWLLTALLSAGHTVDEKRLERLALPMKLLNRLNSAEEPNAALQTTAADVAARQIDNKEVALSLVKGMKAKGLTAQALQLALSNWQSAPQLIRPVSTVFKEHLQNLTPVKLRILGTSTTHPLAEDLVPAFAGCGFHADIDEANFGEVIPELLKPVQGDYNAYILFLDMEGFHSHDWRLTTNDSLKRLNERIDLLVSALTSFVGQSSHPVFINTLPLPPSPAVGFIDRHHGDGITAHIKLVNTRLSELASEQSQVMLIDSFTAMTDLPPTSWGDPKMWFYGRIPYSAEATRALAGGFAKAWRADKKGPAKVLAIDLDNTMWGGIYGEDGVHGLQCGDDFPGNAFKAMQNEFLRLKNQGMILTILSKNNPDAITAFADHPGIILGEDDFVAHRINWTPKPQNIRELAADINVGLDSFVFLDDSPHEREAMRALAPEVCTPELPDDPAQRPGWLRALANTWPIRLTAEDAKRSSMYQAERKAKDLKSAAASFEDYLAGLEQKLIIEEVSEATLPRIAQMHIRTNQFNLTTRRFDESDIKAMMEDHLGHKVLLGRASDKFGDHGISICATISINGQEAELKTLLMSCRVIGREVETAFLGALLENLKANGIERLKASYIPTVKNVIVAEFYSDQGMEKIATIGEETIYQWYAKSSAIPGSSFVETIWHT